MTNDFSNSATVVKDPVCGMDVNPATTRHQLEHAGKSYYFCCGRCAEKFKADPQKYLAQPVRVSSSLVSLGGPVRPAPAAVASPSVKSANQSSYVCPMCPEVRATKPGPCPSCGMALEPEMPPATTIDVLQQTVLLVIVVVPEQTIPPPT